MFFNNVLKKEKMKKSLKSSMVGETNNARNLTLKHLEIIANIAVKTDVFVKDSFFKNGPVELNFWKDFSSLILNPMPEEIPAFEGSLLKTRLKKKMYDSEILSELRNSKPLTITEFAAVIENLLRKQPNGETGHLVNNTYANVFYVQLENKRVVTARVGRYPGSHKWGLSVNGLVGWWFNGDCVFSRN